jgi:hypothetical protein
VRENRGSEFALQSMYVAGELGKSTDRLPGAAGAQDHRAVGPLAASVAPVRAIPATRVPAIWIPPAAKRS